MAVKIGINGYGRIGRNVMRALHESGRTCRTPDRRVERPWRRETNAHLTRFDTAHGKFPGEVIVEGGDLVVNGDRVQVLAERDPSKLPWEDLGVDVVLECTGLFNNARCRREASRCRRQEGADFGARRKGRGRNDSLWRQSWRRLKPATQIVSNASCTTNCLAPLVKPLHDENRCRTRIDDHDSCLHQRSGANRCISQGSAPRQVCDDVDDSDQDRRRRGGRSGAARTCRQARRIRGSGPDASTSLWWI